MFIVALQEIVVQETKDWMTEFQSNMAQMEKDIKAQLDSLRAPGGTRSEVPRGCRKGRSS